MENNKKHILIGDDDDRIRDLLKDYLSENNYIVSTAENADQAKERIEFFKFDIIILDVMMPGKNGLEFIVDHKHKLNTPIILLTAKGQANERVQGLEVGADDYLPKPFEPKELLLRIKNILKKTFLVEQKRVIEFENVKIDLNKLLIIKKNNEFKINSTEKIILEKMINKKVLIMKFILVTILAAIAILSLPILVTKGNTHFKHALEWNYFVGVITFYLFSKFFWRRTT